MKKLLLPIVLLTLASCNQTTSNKPQTQEEMEKEYLSKAIQSETYKRAWMNVQQLKIDLKMAKEGTVNADGLIDEYNNTMGVKMGNVDKLSEVETKLKRDTDYLKIIQLKVAADLALSDAADDNSKIKR